MALVLTRDSIKLQTEIVAPFGELQLVVDQKLFGIVEDLLVVAHLRFDEADIDEADLLCVGGGADLVELFGQERGDHLKLRDLPQCI